MKKSKIEPNPELRAAVLSPINGLWKAEGKGRMIRCIRRLQKNTKSNPTPLPVPSKIKERTHRGP
jgi:hypothetical protein